MLTILSVVLGILTVVGVAASIFFRRRGRVIEQRYSGIADVDAAVAKARKELHDLAVERDRLLEARTKELDALTADHARLTETRVQELDALASEYRQAKQLYDSLKHEITLLEENLEDISFGVYKPHFDYQTSDAYKSALTDIRNKQKEMIRAGQAAACDIEWSVSGSRSEGARMQKQYSKLLLRAFNGECEAAVANVTWNNVVRMEQRITKSFEAINKLGSVMTISIVPDYRDLKLSELRLKHEYEEKQHAEKEEQRRIKERMRDEERAQREIERARAEAEEEETRYAKALEKARAEVGEAQGEALNKVNERIAELAERLQQAHEQKEHAISRAQLTRSGHVYIISNLGSFGERVVKIGLTRRLEPLERIKELGDASVPFEFDVHAILYSDDAPSLEAKLHEAFEANRINLVNARKEFFAVTVDEIEEFMRSQGLTAVLTKPAEARDYRQTLALRNARQEPIAATTQPAEAFPPELLESVRAGLVRPASV